MFTGLDSIDRYWFFLLYSIDINKINFFRVSFRISSVFYCDLDNKTISNDFVVYVSR